MEREPIIDFKAVYKATEDVLLQELHKMIGKDITQGNVSLVTQLVTELLNLQALELRDKKQDMNIEN